jgi:hypothetical protein
VKRTITIWSIAVLVVIVVFSVFLGSRQPVSPATSASSPLLGEAAPAVSGEKLGGGRQSLRSDLGHTVTGAAVSKGAFYPSIKTTGAQSNVVVERFGRYDAEDFASELRSLLANRSQASTRAPAQSAIDELERFAALRDRGVLTDPEVEAQKAKILVS